MQRTLISMLFTLFAVSAGATTITITPANSIPDAYADENAWVLANFGSSFEPETLETFNEFTASNTTGYTSLSTSVGTFSVAGSSQAGSSTLSTGTHQNQFTILDSSDTPFSGRYSTTIPDGGNWLDSNDITGVKLTTSLNTLLFLITDVNDVGGNLTIKTQDGTQSSAFVPSPTAQNGDLYFVAITSSNPIGEVWWLNSSNSDGWGIDDLGTAVDPPAPTPEPATLSIAGLGLAVMVLAKKYKTPRDPQQS